MPKIQKVGNITWKGVSELQDSPELLPAFFAILANPPTSPHNLRLVLQLHLHIVRNLPDLPHALQDLIIEGLPIFLAQHQHFDLTASCAFSQVPPVPFHLVHLVHRQLVDIPVSHEKLVDKPLLALSQDVQIVQVAGVWWVTDVSTWTKSL